MFGCKETGSKKRPINFLLKTLVLIVKYYTEKCGWIISCYMVDLPYTTITDNWNNSHSRINSATVNVRPSHIWLLTSIRRVWRRMFSFSLMIVPWVRTSWYSCPADKGIIVSRYCCPADKGIIVSRYCFPAVKVIIVSRNSCPAVNEIIKSCYNCPTDNNNRQQIQLSCSRRNKSNNRQQAQLACCQRNNRKRLLLSWKQSNYRQKIQLSCSQSNNRQQIQLSCSPKK